MFDGLEPILLDLPCLVKAVRTDGDKRVVAVEASNEEVDQEGDVITQKALLDAAPGFIKGGALDIDHISEIGGRYGITNTSDWIVGVPTGVRDLGGRRTEVTGELHKSVPGQVSKADELWAGLTRDPPVPWRASIFGWPTRKGGLIDARIEKSTEYPNARRYIVKGLDWRSLAFTRHPVNDAITGTAHVVTMKAFVEGLQRRGIIEASWGGGPAPMALSETPHYPRSKTELLGHYDSHIDRGECPSCGKTSLLGKSVAGFTDHFTTCHGFPFGEAEILAHALMHMLRHR
jgi:hypothetical protein